jgi:hypothetical protein
MSKLAILALIVVAAIVSSCGTSTYQRPIQASTSGNWEALLVGGTGEAAKLNFVVGFNVINTNGYAQQRLTVTNFNFLNNNTCFVSGQAVSGYTDLSTDNNGNVTGPPPSKKIPAITLTITSGVPKGNTLTLNTTAFSGLNVNGNLTKGAAIGQWKLTGNSGCNVNADGNDVNATFTFCQNAITCTVLFQ